MRRGAARLGASKPPDRVSSGFSISEKCGSLPGFESPEVRGTLLGCYGLGVRKRVQASSR
jgi:hypothetical protein